MSIKSYTKPMHETAVAANPGARSYPFAARLFVRALKNGLEHFKANPRLWDGALGGTSTREAQAAANLIATSPPSIHAGYPRGEHLAVPQISVVLQEETPHTEVIGSFEGHGRDGGYGPCSEVEVRGMVASQQIGVMVLSSHPDMTLYLYHFARQTLWAHLDWFLAEGLTECAFQRGAELAPETLYLPSELFVRGAVWSVIGAVQWPISMAPPPDDVRATADLAGVESPGVRFGV